MGKKLTREWFIRELEKRYNERKTGENDFTIYLQEFREIFSIIEDMIYDVVENRDTLVLNGLFSIKIVKRNAKKIYNFQTKKSNIVPEKEKVVIIPSKSLADLLVEDDESDEDEEQED